MLNRRRQDYGGPTFISRELANRAAAEQRLLEYTTAMSGAAVANERTEDTELLGYATFAGQVLDKTADLVRSSFRSDFVIEKKSDGTPVTSVDRAVETILRHAIEDRFPSHGICGEEFDPKAPQSPWTWLLDPIDGTKAWIAGRPTFTTLVALCRDGQAVLGIMDQPITGERWLGIAGAGASLNGKRTVCRGVAQLGRAVMACSNPLRALDRLGEGFPRLADRCLIAINGGDSYLVGLLASGQVDLVVDCGLAPVDYCALIPIIEAAGGTVSDFGGRALTMTSDGTFLAAATTALHRAALDEIAGRREGGAHASTGARS